MQLSAFFRNFKNGLFKPVDSSILGYFRIAFGLVMLVTYTSVKTYFVEKLAIQKFFFTYDGFDWVKLLSPDELGILFTVLQISAVLFTLGILYRFNSVLQFTGWTYLFLTDRGHYNNHYYFFSIILFFFILVDANRWAAIGSKSKNEVPYWQLLIFRLQIFVVYFFGGIAKLDADWLLGHPMVNVLPGQVSRLPGFAAAFFSSYTGAVVFSWAGLVFDLGIGFMLFSKRWRYWALLPIAVFHIMNHFLWTIGSFPWAMLFATFLFFNPAWPRWLVQYVRQKLTGAKTKKKEAVTLPWKNSSDFLSAPSFSIKKIVVAFVVVHFALQFTLPLRHWLYKGDVGWTGEGHLFAWRMMLTNSDDAIRMKVIIPRDNVEFYVDFFAYMHRQQLNKITKTPTMMLKFVHHIQHEIENASGIKDVDIRLEMYKSVNYRPAKLLNDTTLNYALVPYEPIKQATWILPWQRKNEELQRGIHDAENWDGVL